jgi:hypothetical protein
MGSAAGELKKRPGTGTVTETEDRPGCRMFQADDKACVGAMHDSGR